MNHYANCQNNNLNFEFFFLEFRWVYVADLGIFFSKAIAEGAIAEKKSTRDASNTNRGIKMHELGKSFCFLSKPGARKQPLVVGESEGKDREQKDCSIHAFSSRGWYKVPEGEGEKPEVQVIIPMAKNKVIGITWDEINFFWIFCSIIVF